jgi:hypothetical protein
MINSVGEGYGSGVPYWSFEKIRGYCAASLFPT